MHDAELFFSNWYRDVSPQELAKPQVAKWEWPVYAAMLAAMFAAQIYFLSP
jgi:hypothetical protein